MDVFERQDTFIKKMLEDYKNGVISNPIYEPYFNWKMGKIHFSDLNKEDVLNMREAAQEELDPYYDKYSGVSIPIGEGDINDVWHDYRMFGNDAYIVSYLEAIDAELSDILVAQIL